MGRASALAVTWLIFLSVVANDPGLSKKAAFTPILTRRPFIVAWNVPVQDCWPRFRVQLDLSMFDVLPSASEGFRDQSLTSFYKERLGLYPYYDEKKVPVNGGIPQNSSLIEHLDQLRESILRYIRSESKEGLAVIKWEDWRPTWIRNWLTKAIYRNASRQLVLARQPGLPEEQVEKEAQSEFEASAREFMKETLRYAKNLRPQQLWGYFKFPNCYNYDYKKNQDNYTGHCPEVEKTRNDRLSWLWKESTALYPSIYLEKMLANTTNGLKFVRSRVEEALRISQQHQDSYALPVFVYTSPTYFPRAYQADASYLSEMDLVSTIGESAALGAAGAIFWGGAENARSRRSCQGLKNYIEEDLGRYIINVTTAAQLCSQTLCSSHGRCQRRSSRSGAFLHLNPASFQIHGNSSEPPLVAKGELSQEDVAFLRSHFQCHCYQGWTGEGCETQPSGGVLHPCL